MVFFYHHNFLHASLLNVLMFIFQKMYRYFSVIISSYLGGVKSFNCNKKENSISL